MSKHQSSLLDILFFITFSLLYTGYGVILFLSLFQMLKVVGADIPVEKVLTQVEGILLKLVITTVVFIVLTIVTKFVRKMIYKTRG